MVVSEWKGIYLCKVVVGIGEDELETFELFDLPIGPPGAEGPFDVSGIELAGYSMMIEHRDRNVQHRVISDMDMELVVLVDRMLRTVISDERSRDL